MDKGCTVAGKVSLRHIYLSFLWVGTVLFGGGYAMLPLLEREVVVRRKWCSYDEMSELYALSQVVPGVIAVNAAMLIGQRYRGSVGAIVATLGMITVPLIAICAIASSYAVVTEWPVLNCLFASLRPAVAGLLMATALGMVIRGCKVRWEWLVAALAAVMAMFGLAGPLKLIIGAVAGGVIWHLVAIRKLKGGGRA